MQPDPGMTVRLGQTRTKQNDPPVMLCNVYKNRFIIIVRLTRHFDGRKDFQLPKSRIGISCFFRPFQHFHPALKKINGENSTCTACIQIEMEGFWI